MLPWQEGHLLCSRLSLSVTVVHGTYRNETFPGYQDLDFIYSTGMYGYIYGFGLAVMIPNDKIKPCLFDYGCKTPTSHNYDHDGRHGKI